MGTTKRSNPMYVERFGIGCGQLIRQNGGAGIGVDAHFYFRSGNALYGPRCSSFPISRPRMAASAAGKSADAVPPDNAVTNRRCLPLFLQPY
jgi:hypothetical protein